MSSTHSTKRNAARSPRSFAEPLEPRLLFSTISWTNRGTMANDTDGFNSVFGANSEWARGVVRAALDAWQQRILFFNYSNGTNTFSIDISMEPAGTGAGA